MALSRTPRLLCNNATGDSSQGLRIMGVAAVPLGVIGTWIWIHHQGSDPPKSHLLEEDADISRAAVNARYELKAKLGKGGFGDVFVAVDNQTGQLVAIKILSVAAQPKEMIEAEAYAMRRIGRHPNVVGLRDVVWVMPDHQNAKGEVTPCTSCFRIAMCHIPSYIRPLHLACLSPPPTPPLPPYFPPSLRHPSARRHGSSWTSLAGAASSSALSTRVPTRNVKPLASFSR